LVEKHLQRPRQPVLRLPLLARMVPDHLLGDARAGPLGVDGDEAVHLTVEPDRLEHLAPISLEGAAVVVQAHAAHPADEPVGDLRRQAPGERLVLPILPPPRHDVVALLEAREQERDVLRIVLQIGVHRHHDRGARAIEARRHRRRLAEVAAEPDQPQPGPALGRRFEACEAVVGRSVVDDEDLGRPPLGLELGDGGVQRGAQPGDRLFLVEARDDDRNLGRPFRHRSLIAEQRRGVEGAAGSADNGGAPC